MTCGISVKHSALWKPSSRSYRVLLCARASQSLANNIHGTPLSPTPAFCIASFSLVPWPSHFSNFSSSEHQTQMNTLAKWNHRPLLWPLLMDISKPCVFPSFWGSYLHCLPTPKISCHRTLSSFTCRLLRYGKLCQLFYHGWKRSWYSILTLNW